MMCCWHLCLGSAERASRLDCIREAESDQQCTLGWAAVPRVLGHCHNNWPSAPPCRSYCCCRSCWSAPTSTFYVADEARTN